MYHTLWPEGQPDKAFQTESYWKASWHLFKSQFHYQLPWNWRRARRMRWSQAAAGFPHPYVVEQAIREAGGTPPPGGWTLQSDVCEGDLIFGDVYTHTYSVI